MTHLDSGHTEPNTSDHADVVRASKAQRTMPVTGVVELGRQLAATALAAVLNYPTPGLGRHAMAEAVTL